MHERERRSFRGQRAVRIGLRTLHIGSVAMVVGAVGAGAEPGGWSAAMVATGLGLAGLDLYKEGPAWFRYTQSWAVALKVAMLAAGALEPRLLLASLWGALVVGGVISHAPGRLRQAPLWGPPGPCAKDP